MQAHEGDEASPPTGLPISPGSRSQRLGDIGTGLRRPTAERGLYGSLHTKLTKFEKPDQIKRFSQRSNCSSLQLLKLMIESARFPPPLITACPSKSRLPSNPVAKKVVVVVFNH